MPLSFVLFAGLVGFVAAGAVVTKLVGFARSRQRRLGEGRMPGCPACRGRLEIDEAARSFEPVADTEIVHLIEAYRCTGCSGEFRQRDRGPVVSLEAFGSGAELPTARIHRR